LGKGSVGLGLATRQTSITTFQDKKYGRTSFVFLLASLTLLISNIIVSDTTSNIKQSFVERTLFIQDIVAKPMIAIDHKIANIKAIWDMQENQAMLVSENARLMKWYQMANRLDAENKALRELLNMKDDSAIAYHSGEILTDTKTPYSNTILVRLGQIDGLDKGQGVLSHEGLIGRVIESGQQTSRVLLLNDINSRIPVTVDGQSVRAILAGTNNGDPVLDHLPETHTIVAGEKIITSGYGGIFPYGVPVGETYLGDNGQLAVRPYADASRASHVQIVDYGVPAGSTTRSTASNATGILR
jgi:rod shape-determining protein MreC